MKSEEAKRPYQMTNRAEQVAQNERSIMAAVNTLWRESSVRDITLEKVAELSGVTVRTILRKYGSKDGLLEACIENETGDFEMKRDQAPDGDFLLSLKYLLLEYEDNGDAVIRTVAIADELPIAKKLLETGLAQHRDWCARIFEPFLPDPAAPEYEPRLLAFITATEIHLWKLLRRDLNQDFDQTYQVFQSLLEGLILKFQE